MSGVPQGSVPGPILFLIYINDLPEKISSSIKIFANDTKVYSPITQPGDKDCLQKKKKKNILEACRWAGKWQMSFNVKKCKSMHIGKNEPSEYYIEDTKGNKHNIEQVNQEKDLGVIFDKNLNFDIHILKSKLIKLIEILV